MKISVNTFHNLGQKYEYDREKYKKTENLIDQRVAFLFGSDRHLYFRCAHLRQYCDVYVVFSRSQSNIEILGNRLREFRSPLLIKVE